MKHRSGGLEHRARFYTRTSLLAATVFPNRSKKQNAIGKQWYFRPSWVDERFAEENNVMDAKRKMKEWLWRAAQLDLVFSHLSYRLQQGKQEKGISALGWCLQKLIYESHVLRQCWPKKNQLLQPSSALFLPCYHVAAKGKETVTTWNKFSRGVSRPAAI